MLRCGPFRLLLAAAAVVEVVELEELAAVGERRRWRDRELAVESLGALLGVAEEEGAGIVPAGETPRLVTVAAVERIVTLPAAALHPLPPLPPQLAALCDRLYRAPDETVWLRLGRLP